MAYAKLDTGILDSTLWVDRDGRDVFLTALLMAQPREVRQPTPAVAVRDLEPTGFVVPPGWYGHVDAAGVGILKRAAVVDIEAGMAALERLGAPDLESRTLDHEGRRLVRVNGGWLVLNFMAYRDKDHTGAERARRYRDRKKAAEAEDPSRRDVTLQGRDVTQADADADADAKDQKPEPSPGKPASPVCPQADIVALYHAILPEGRGVRAWTGKREAWLKARWRESKERQSLAWWTAYFQHVRNSDFLMGKVAGRNGGKPFEVSLEWLVNESNLVNVMEGKYHG